MSKIRVAVIFGGASNEHDISLISATSVIQNIPLDRYEVICIGITRKGRWLYYPGDVRQIAGGEWESHPDCVSAILSPDPIHKGFIKLMDDGTTSLQRVDCIFPVLHGKNGEDGTIQGLFALSGIPYVGCDTLSSAVCMDKAITHTILDYNGIRTARWDYLLQSRLADLEEACGTLESKLSYPMFVKPANCGSSIGINKVCDREQLKNAIKLAFTHDRKVVVEEQIVGTEVECAVMGNDFPSASIVGGIVPCNEFYDYDAKYIMSNTELHIPAHISKESASEVRKVAVQAYKALGCSGLTRIDFFVTDDGGVVLNEPNTLPGFTSISMYPKLMEASGVPYAELIDTLINLALERADVTYG